MESVFEMYNNTSVVVLNVGIINVSDSTFVFSFSVVEPVFVVM